ncbi:SRPBCC family protein [Lutibacter sp.]
MKFLKYLFVAILIGIVAFAGYIATSDGTYDVKQSREFKIPVEVVFKSVNDFKNWEHWGPWYQIDSTIVTTYPENTSGVNASYSWVGKDGNGGSMKTLSLIPNKEIIQEINFGMGATPKVYWNFETTPKGTMVTWGMKGESGFMEKIYWLTQGGIQKNLEPMYQRGLKQLEEYLTKEMEKHSLEVVGITTHKGGYYLYQTTTCGMESIGEKMGEMYANLGAFMQKHMIKPSGYAFSISHRWDEKNNQMNFSACFPIENNLKTDADILIAKQPAQKCFKFIAKGDYKFLQNAWNEASKTIKEQGYTETKDAFEVYINGPNNTQNPAEWITEIYIPVN